MAHTRARYLRKQLLRELSWSPCVSIYGMRQAGKTTLVRALAGSYLTLDDESVVSQFQAGDWSPLEAGRAPVAVDEAQKYGPLFDRVKLLVDRKKAPGRFLLTGSVRFSLRKEIRESLTGRTTLVELLPLTIAECHELPLHDAVERGLTLSPERWVRALEGRRWCSRAQLDHYLRTGGMPGICFRRDEAVRVRLWSSHLDTVLARDLPLILKTKLTYPRLRELYTLLARDQGKPVNVLELSRSLGVSRPTTDALLRAFEGLFLIRGHGSTFYCEDQGLASYALGAHELEPRYRSYRWIFGELLAQTRYHHPSQATLEAFRTRGGAEVPFVIGLGKRGSLAVTFDTGDGPSEKSLKSLTSYRKRNPRARSLALHLGTRGFVTASGCPSVPLEWLA